jgi:hypothetical protein
MRGDWPRGHEIPEAGPAEQAAREGMGPSEVFALGRVAGWRRERRR